MKTCLRVVCIGVSLLCTIFSTSPVAGQTIGDGYFNQAGIQPGMADLNVGWPGRVWVQVNVADQGLGYEGSYVTLGAKQHLFQDFMDGRWLLETRGHYDPENEGFFGNLGIERVFSLYAAGAEISTGFWLDYDDTQQTNFSHSMSAIGVSGSIETRRWALLANGYFPIGDSQYNQADPLNGDCFLNHSIVTVAGIDSALQGFDALFQVKPTALAHVNGTLGLGGYQYNSDLVDSFAGVRARLGMQFDGGMIVSAEANHDDRFDFTGSLQIGWLFGAGARGTEYGLLGTDLEPTIRNDHVVRFNQGIQLAIDPDTGRPYNVYHVDNLATAGGDGTVENPFDSLASAEAASAEDDIIFVREGGGTTRNMDQGIALKDGQLLLGDGVQHLIPLADGTNFVLCNDVDGLLPTITNLGVGNAVDLANRNTVRGFVIDGSGGGMQNGISGNAGMTLTGGVIEDVTITGNPILNGVLLNDIAGDWNFARNDIQSANFDGINISNANDPNSVFTFTENNVSSNGRDGIHIDNFDAALVNFVDNTTNENGRDGVRIENHIDSLGIGTNIRFLDTDIASIVPDPLNPTSTAEANENDGISIMNVNGDVRFLNMEIRNNLNSGINLVNVTTPGADQRVFIGTTTGNSIFDGNGVGTGAGIFNDLGVVTGEQQLFITDTLIQNGGSGIVSQATATSANLRTDIIDNNGILNVSADGILLNASGGATHTALVENTGTPLNITNAGGNGISVNSSGDGSISLMETDINNVLITNSGGFGIRSSVIENGQVILRAQNTTINGAIDGINIAADNDAATSVNEYRFTGINITNVLDDGIDIDLAADTLVDFELVTSNLDNSALGLGDHGIEATATGDILPATSNTRLRMLVVGNIINGYDGGDGVGITSNGDSNVLAILEANTISNNGQNTNATGTGTLPFSDGIDITANDSSLVATRIRNNNINGNGEQGLDINSNGTASVTAVVSGNNLSGNDVSDDPATVPIESGNADFTVSNGATAEVCLSLSNNFFNLPAILTNLSGSTNFTLEQDGASNGPGAIIQLGNAPGAAPFGTVCEPAIQVQEIIFAANGFPPLP